MGMSYTGFGAPVTVKNLKVNADLDLGNYDLIATDVKGDTAEFGEFVGGVGNFESGLVSGGFDVSGIMHAESTLQVDGNIILEGSINNVNIADNGEITTSQGVNGADFNGAKITSTKFNGATIDASGNITTAKFNGVTLGENLFNGRRIRPILSTNTGGENFLNMGSTIQALANLAPYTPTANGTYQISRPLLNGHDIPIYDIPSNLTYELRITANASITMDIALSGSFTKTISFANVTNATASLTYAQAVAFVRNGCTLTISNSSSSSSVITQITLRGSISSGSQRIFIHY